MQYYSLNHTSPAVSFRTATIQGQAPDKGLYFPETIPALPSELISHIDRYAPEEIALAVIRPYVGDDIPNADLERIVAETINFDFPLVPVTGSISSLELFHGPTLAFKDVGARFMSRCLGYFVGGGGDSGARDDAGRSGRLGEGSPRGRGVTVLVATSGDTGGAVASGFYGVEGVDVVILYPSGKVSSVQELQLTTLGKNISALEVSGSFDDCQRMVKQAFADTELARRLFLTSANSINVARWLPQQFYYLFAWRQWPDKDNPPVISVPSGNFGNICAGLLAHRSGLPVNRFIAACNANNVVPAFLQTGRYAPRPAVATLSNAMDVGDPSNFVRILELFDKAFDSLSKVLTSYSITDEETRATIRKVFAEDHYLPDPHGAVGYLALARYLEEQAARAISQSSRVAAPPKGFFLETAHPVKFYDAVEPIIGQKVPIPESVGSLLGRKKQSTRIEADFACLKEFLLDAARP